MKITELLFGPRRPGRRRVRRQADAIRAKTATAWQQLADTDAMLARREGSAK